MKVGLMFQVWYSMAQSVLLLTFDLFISRLGIHKDKLPSWWSIEFHNNNNNKKAFKSVASFWLCDKWWNCLSVRPLKKQGQTQWVMTIGAIPHYATVFNKVGIRLLRLSQSSARSGCVRLLRVNFLHNCLLFAVWDLSPPFPHNK